MLSIIAHAHNQTQDEWPMWDFSKFKNDTALITEDGNTISYSDLDSLSKELNSNIPPRSLVMHLCTNELGSLLGYISFIQNKSVPILLSASLAKEALQDFINRYSPDYMFLPSDKEDFISSSEVVYSKFGYSLIKTNLNLKLKTLNNDLALLLTTSGSTGSPKLIRLSYKNLESNTVSIVKYLNIAPQDRAVTSLPMNYTYGLSVINSHLFAGASLLLTTKTIMQKEFWEIFRKFNITSLAGVPYTYSMLDKLQFFKMELPSLKTLTQAGGKLSLGLHEKFASWAKNSNKKFIVMYGQTEATARMSYLPHDQSLQKIGSIGIPIPNGDFEIINEAGIVVSEPEASGELVYVGDNVALGYAETESDLALGDAFKGRLQTGDIGKKDVDGYYYVIGRKKRFLKIFGNRVSLDEAENIIKEHFAIDDCACTGRDDKMFIFICSEVFQKDIIPYISKYTSLHPTAFKVVVIEKLPKSDAGKILYKDLEQYCD